MKIEKLECKFVDAQGLLESLWAKPCRPCVRWVRDMQKQGKIPFAKIGRRVFFDPEQVRAKLFGNATMQEVK